MTKRRTSKKRTSRRPARRKRASKYVRPNVIPPPPQYQPQYMTWLGRTYAIGTRVEFLANTAAVVVDPSQRSRIDIPSGTRGEVVSPGPYMVNGEGWIHVRLFPAPYAGTRAAFLADDLRRRGTDVVMFHAPSIHNYLRALDDNWASAPKPMSRHSLPFSQKRTSRKLRPNATCPSCGSPHYFEGLTTRDCATPSCRYYRGGTVDPHFQSESPAVKRVGSRRLGFTSETVHASEPDVYPEITNEQLEDIVIEADDLDDDETFAEAAAKVIAEELGHVEGSEHRGPSRWYTQSDPSEDYRTGDSTRRSIHIDGYDWTDEEQKEIYDTLKRRKLVS